jgi:L-cystine uptake protein TcyP (sodium:dicarboxylate symporter family)
MTLVEFALKITPYGVLGLFAKISMNLDVASVLKLLNFVLISYLAIFIMFIFHGLLLSIFKINPISYYNKISELLTFGFFSRSSSATIPLNIKTQVEKLKISPHNATISATFGSIVGQNGCAGIYPAMLVAMVGAGMGVEISSLNFILYLILVVTVNSFGIAGVGGGAIFAAIASLSVFEMPFAIITLLAGIEPIIDMARTALNINGAVVSSVITEKITSSSSKD